MEHPDIQRLIQTCRGVDGASIKDKEKLFLEFERALSKTHILHALDKNSDKKKQCTEQAAIRRIFAWDNVFKFVTNVVWTEKEAIAKYKSIDTSAASKRRHQASSMFKYVVRQADKRGKARMKASDVVKHVLRVVDDDFGRECFGADHCSVLFKDILCMRKYWPQLRKEHWQELLLKFTEFLQNGVSCLDRVLLARTVSVTIQASVTQCDIRSAEIMPLFTKYFTNIKNEGSAVVVEHMLSGLNVLCERVAGDCRRQVCRIGEDITKQLLFIWNHRASEKLKEEIVRFLLLQLHVHHPRGAHDEKTGAFALCWDTWKSLLRQIYELVYNEIQESCGRSKFASGVREAGSSWLKEDFVTLAADVCHQLFTENGGASMVEVTCMDITLSEQHHHQQAGPAAKKRRVETGWGLLKERLVATPPQVPWLQLVQCLLERHPCCIPEEELVSMLSTLQQLQPECRKPDATMAVLKALTAVCTSQQALHAHLSLTEFSSETCVGLWTKVAAGTVRLLSLHHAEVEGYDLLRHLLQLPGVALPDVCSSLFIPVLSRPSSPAVSYLAHHLRHQPLAHTKPCYKLRHQLVDWLLPAQDDFSDSPAAIAQSHQNEESGTDIAIKAEILVALSCRDPTSIYVAAPPREKPNKLEKIENLYLWTLKEEVGEDSRKEKTQEEKEEKRSDRIEVEVWDKVVDMLKRDCLQLMDMEEVDMSSVLACLHQCRLLQCFFFSVLKHKLKTLTQIKHMELFKLWKELVVKKISPSFRDISKLEVVAANSMVSLLEEMLQHTEKEGQQLTRTPLPEMIKEAKQLTRMVLPETMATGFIKYLQDKRAPAQPQQRRASSSHAPSVDQLDLDDFDDNANASNALDYEDPTDSSSISESQDSDFSSGDESCLSVEEQLRLGVVRLLCLWLLRGTERQRLAEHVDEEVTEWEPRKTVDLLMLEQLIDGLSRNGITENDIEIFLEAIRSVCKEHKHDQEVCSLVLRCIARLVTHLQQGEEEDAVSEGLKDSRTIALHLLGIFWKTREQYTTEVRLQLADCMAKFIQVDPESQWTVWKVRAVAGEGGGDGGGGGTRREELHEELANLLTDSSLSVRFTTATHKIKWMFIRKRGEKEEAQPKEKQAQHFQKIQELLAASLDQQKGRRRLHPDEMADELQNYTASALLTLATVASISPVCEKSALLAICSLTHSHNLDTELVKQVLQQVSLRLHSPDLCSLMSSHLPFLLQEWLSKEKHSIQNFPWQLTGYMAQRQFFKNERKNLVRFCVLQRDAESMKLVCGCGRGGGGGSQEDHTEEAMLECLPLCLTHILPLFAAHKADLPHQLAQAKKANHCYDWIINKLTGQSKIEQCITSRLDEVVFNILLTLWDENDTFNQDSDPTPNPPHYGSDIVRCTLEYLTHSHDNAKSLVTLLANNQGGIQRVCLWLAVCVRRARREPERRRLLLVYRLWVELLLKDFHQELGGAWAYVLRDTLHNLLHIINTQPNSVLITRLSIDILTSVCRVAVEACPEELGRFLPALVSGLTALSGEEVEGQARALVHFLLVDNCVELRAAIVLLDPVPYKEPRRLQDKYKYAHGPFSLEQECEHFLRAGEQSHGRHRLEGLRFLQTQLHKHPKELQKLVKKAQDAGSEGVLARLVYELVELCGGGELDSAAAQCLGELGPVPLGVTALTPPPGGRHPSLTAALKQYEDSSREQAYCHIMHTLHGYLIDAQVDTVLSASEVLKAVLATKTGATFATQYKQKVNDHFFQYLQPFRTRSKKYPASPLVCMDGFAAAMKSTENVWSVCNHAAWIRNLTTTLLNTSAITDHIFSLLSPVCKVKSEFCELVLPYLVHDILLHGKDEQTDTLCQHIMKFFQQDQGQGDYKKCVRSLLKVIQYMRQQPRPQHNNKRGGGASESTAWDNNFWLELDYLSIARAAHHAGDHFTALLYTEIWCYKQKAEEEEEAAGGSTNSSCGSLPSSQQRGGNSQVGWHIAGQVSELLLHTYRAIGDPDAVYSCGTSTHPQARVKMYEHEEKWAEAVGTYDTELSTDGATAQPGLQPGLLESMYKFGSWHVLEKYLESVPQSPEVREYQFKMAASTGNWQLDFIPRLSGEKPGGYHEAMYLGLVSVREGELCMAQAAVESARRLCTQGLLATPGLCCRGLYPLLSKLQCVQTLQHAISDSAPLAVQMSGERCGDGGVDYDFIEPVLAARYSVLSALVHRDSRRDGEERRGGGGGGRGEPQQITSSSIPHLLLSWATTARHSKRFQVCERVLGRLRGHEVGEEARQMEEAKLFWARNEHSTAKTLLKNIIKNIQQQQTLPGNEELYPQCLGLYGDWLAETQSENPSHIMDNYLLKAVELLKESDSELALDACLSLARFADAQYRNIVDYMQSATFESKCQLVKRAKEDVTKLQEMGGDLRRYLSLLTKQTAIDEAEVMSLQAECARFLQCAVKHYVACLHRGAKHNMRVFRLTALWFDNCTGSGSEAINAIMEESCASIGSHKFLPLLYQLAARMSQDNTPFHHVLNKLLERVVTDHPHHSLNVVLALAHANKDQELLMKKTASGRSAASSKLAKQQQQQDESRVLAAKALLERLRKKGGVMAARLKDMERLSVAYIYLANFNVDQYKRETKPINLPPSIELRNIRDLELVSVSTVDVPVDVTGSYDNITHIHSFQPTFKLAGGINLPKIISCIGSDGVARRQLVKGRDDLRQDAVMQQVFGLVNTLLRADAQCRQRHLNVRTYKVIPLSQRSGLLEWCEGTTPLGEYLINPKDGAHLRYRPMDLKAVACRKAMMDAQVKEKVKAFAAVCHRFQPVFRHFFLERWLEPAQWYERRTAYTRSVATNSIVGYILGLGDRHVQNILIDCQTAELVHIDLGVAFEQGRILPTPETVPFRLTRDIVDGMGVAGVEGCFRRCCEKTMAVMHANHEALITILQVLLYDPLYAWTLSPEKACKLQQARRGAADPDTTAENTDIFDITTGGAGAGGTSASTTEHESKNKVAERVLLRLQQKLAGVEDGVQLSLAGQVNHLIHSGRDPANLAKLFPGWQPYI